MCFLYKIFTMTLFNAQMRVYMMRMIDMNDINLDTKLLLLCIDREEMDGITFSFSSIYTLGDCLVGDVAGGEGPCSCCVLPLFPLFA